MTNELHQQHPEHVMRPLKLISGGTNAKTPPQALDNLNGVPSTRIGQPLGIVPLNANGKVPPQYLQPGDVVSFSLTGPLTIFNGGTYLYFITDYNLDTVYTITSDTGVIFRDSVVSPDRFSFTPNVLTTDNANTGFTVNGMFYPVTVVPEIITKPTITTPVNNAVVGSHLYILNSNTFVSSNADSNIQKSIWQISNTIDFSVTSEIEKTAQFYTHSLTNLMSNLEFYIRIKYVSNFDNMSEWSDVIHFTTHIVDYPINEIGYVAKQVVGRDFKSGQRIDLSSSGRVFVISQTEEASPDQRQGFLTINTIDANNNVQMQQVIYPDASTIEAMSTDMLAARPYGAVVKLADDGNLLYVFTVVWSNNSNGSGPYKSRLSLYTTTIRDDFTNYYLYTWLDIDIFDPANHTFDREGFLVVSEDGSTIALQSYAFHTNSYNATYIKLYHFDGNVITFNQNINDPLSVGYGFGVSFQNLDSGDTQNALAMSNDGNRLVIRGETINSVINNRTSVLHVYHKVLGVWEHSQSITGATIAEEHDFCYSFNLSGNGNTLIVTDSNSPTIIFNYEHNGTEFIIKQTFDLFYLTTHGGYVDSIALSDNGEVVIMGSSYASDVGFGQAWQGPGVVCVLVKGLINSDLFNYVTTLALRPTNRPDMNESSEFGTAVALSSDGKTCIVGASEFANRSGGVFVFK